MAALPRAPELVTITTPGGARFSVAKAHQAAFQGLVNDLEAGGYALNPKTSGGFNSRYIAGTQTPSEHAFGRAIDVNWDENPRGGRGKIPRDVALSSADKYGMTWGGTWKNPDDMHFEIRQLTPGGALTKVAVPNAPSPDFGGGNITSLVKDDPSTWVLDADNTYTGTTTISAGTLQVGSGGATGSLGSGAGAVTNNSSLVINHSNTTTVSNLIGGTGTLTQAPPPDTPDPA